MNKFSILTIALISALGATTACSSATKRTDDNKSLTSTTERSSTANEKTNSENKTAEEDSAKAKADGLPELKKGEDYTKIVSEKMLRAGWKRARSATADWCGDAEPTCDEFEEYESKTNNDLTNFRWKKEDKFVEISCSGGDRPYTFESYQIEKDSTTIAQKERWNEFWNELRAAVNKKDKEKLQLLMTEKIDGGGAVETREERIAAIEKSGMWEDMQKTVSEGTKLDKCGNNPCRSTKDGYLLFNYETARWQWSGLGGEGGG